MRLVELIARTGIFSRHQGPLGRRAFWAIVLLLAALWFGALFGVGQVGASARFLEPGGDALVLYLAVLLLTTLVVALVLLVVSAARLVDRGRSRLWLLPYAGLPAAAFFGQDLLAPWPYALLFIQALAVVALVTWTIDVGVLPGMGRRTPPAGSRPPSGSGLREPTSD